MNTIYTNLSSSYQALHRDIESSSNSIEERVNALKAYICENAEALTKDLAMYGDHLKLYKDILDDVSRVNCRSSLIRTIERIGYSAELLVLEAIAKDPEKLPIWLNRRQHDVVINRNSSPSEILEAFDALRPKTFGGDCDYAFSKIVISCLGLESKKMEEIGTLFKTGKIDAKTAAYFVNAKKRSLKYLGLSVEELSRLAPRLHYVDTRDIPFKDTQEIQKFIQSTNAYQLIINSEKITELTNLPETLERLDCRDCPSLEKIDCSDSSLKTLELSNLSNLKDLVCQACLSLTGLTLSNLSSLESLECSQCYSLTALTLSNLFSLKEINCRRNESIKTVTLSNLTALTDLDCSYCTSLPVLDISDLTALTSLDCSHCTSLNALTLSNHSILKRLECESCTSLPVLDLANLNSLECVRCMGCTSLSALLNTNLNSLEELNCCHCTSLPVLDLLNLSKLSTLLFRNCTSLKEISLTNLTAIKWLDCGNLTSLKALSILNFPSLIELKYYTSPSLTTLTLSNLTALKQLNLYNLRSLKEITLTNLTALETLDCGGHTALITLTLSNLTALKKLNCKRCTSLTTLAASNLNSLEELNCSDCRVLENIRAVSLPSCRHLDHNSCPRLQQLPQLPNGGTVISYGSIGFTSFTVNPEKLQKQPLEVLCDLGGILLRDKRMPNIVYLNSPGLDHGGLRRQLVTTLLKNLFGKGSSLTLTEELVEGVLPYMSDLNNEKQALAFRTLGGLVALASLGSLPLGRYFRDNFYYALLHSEGESEKRIYQLLHALPESDEVTIKEIEENLSLIRPVALAAKEFRNIAPARAFELKEFITMVAGEEVTFEAFEKRAVYTGEPEGISKTKGYFEEFFKEYKGSPKLLDMIELFTASRALGQESIKILIKRDKNRESLLEMATCFNQVTLPLYETYEKFKDKFFITAEYALSRFDKA